MTPTLIGVCGYAQVGKDSVAHVLHDAYDYDHRSFAWRLRMLAHEVNPLLPDGRTYRQALGTHGYHMAKESVPGFRQVLKDLGAGARKVLGKDVWVTPTLADIKGPTVVSDVRFQNEAEAIGAVKDSLLIRVTRPGYKAESNFEAEVPYIVCDVVIDNDGTLVDLANKVHAVMREVTGNCCPDAKQMAMF